MHLQSFFSRLLISVLLLTAIVLVVVIYASYEPIEKHYQQQLRHDQAMMTQLATAYFANAWPENSTPADAQCRDIFNGNPIRLTVIADDGRVLGDSQADSSTMENHKTDSRQEVLSALAGKPGSAIRSSDTLGTEFLYYALPVERDGKIVGCVRTAMPVRTIAQNSGVIKNTFKWAALMAVAVAIVIAILISWMWQRPLKQVSLAARRIADGNLEKKVRVTGSQELVELARSLNEMRDSLAEKIKRILSQQENLSAVIENLTEGIVAIDAQKHVLLCNEIARDLLQCRQQNFIGMDVQLIVRNPDVITMIDRAAAEQRTIDTRIKQDNGKILEVHAVVLSALASSNITMLIVFRDITESEKIAIMKTQFVANASHELRTPLATIRAAIDSLSMSEEPVDEETLKKSLAILDRHAKRLEEMTNDLLDLQMTEASSGKHRREIVSIMDLREWVSNHFSHKAAEKKINFEILAPESGFRFTSDVTLLHLILQNLITNAVKFTPEKGSIECILKPGDGRLTIRVKDNGCGIPEEFHSRVFERFFQVDPARSGDSRQRGTGLGLAIVKHATNRLDGEIDLKSAPGEGTIVTVTIPV